MTQKNKNKIRVLHVITGTGVGGAETSLLRLLQHMDPSRFQQEVIGLTGEGPIAEQIRKLGVPVNSLEMRGKWDFLRGWLRLRDFIREGHFDVIQSWMYHADLLSLLATRSSAGLPLAWNIRHTDLSCSDNRISTLAIAKLCSQLSKNGPAAIVVCAEAAKASHQNFGYDSSKMTVIPNGVDTKKFRPMRELRKKKRAELGIDDSALLVGLVARYHPQKDHSTFIAMAAVLVKKFDSSLRFVLVGHGCDTQNMDLMEALSRYGVADRFILLGVRSDIAEIFSALDLHVLSSRGEGFPNVLAEAMSCAIPCVSTQAGDAVEILGDSTLSCPIKDPQALADCATRVLALDEAARLKLGARLRERIETRFSMAAMTRAYESLYERLSP